MTKIALTLHTAPYDIELLPGVTITVEPFKRAMLREADRMAGIDDTTADDGAEGDGAEAMSAERLEARVVSLAQLSIRDWAGIGDADGNPVSPTPDLIEQLMQDTSAFVAFQRKYMLPAMQVVSEGND